MIVDPDDPNQQAILYTHYQRSTDGSCRCGWSKLGASHSAHVLTLLRDHLAPQPLVLPDEDRTRKWQDRNGHVWAPVEYEDEDGYGVRYRWHDGGWSLALPWDGVLSSAPLTDAGPA